MSELKPSDLVENGFLEGNRTEQKRRFMKGGYTVELQSVNGRALSVRIFPRSCPKTILVHSNASQFGRERMDALIYALGL